MNSFPVRERGPRLAALVVWLLTLLAILGDVVRRPLSHTTMPTYRLAAANWWAGIDPYTTDSHAGFLYFPQAAILFTPFGWGPRLLGDFLYRATVFGLFAYALHRLTRFFLVRKKGDEARSFLLLSLLSIPASLASLRNAQFDLPLAALVVLATVEIAQRRWTAATVWLCLALALKPLALVPLLLFGALHVRALLPRLALGLVVTLLLPFLNPHPVFVAHEYFRCAQTLVWAAQPHEPKFSDLVALADHTPLRLPDAAWTALRLSAALGYLGLGFLASRRLAPFAAAFSVGALSADYLMLFNPRTEACSFVFLSPWVAALALFYGGENSRRWMAPALMCAALGLACDAVPVIHYLTDRWLKPLIALLFLPVLVAFVLRPAGAARK